MKKFLILILTPFIVYGVNLKNGSSPILSLVGSSNINIEAGTTYTDPGANANDNEDGDLTSQIIITGSVDSNTLGVYSIIYSVTDSDGNTTSLTRFVNVIDTTKPVINLLGDSEITLSLGQLYNEQGATAIDNLDGDITSSIEISGNVNHNSAGIYFVKYDVSDSSGNQADTVYRNVYVGDWQDQEKVIAVWDFNDGSTDGIIDPYFNLSQTSLGFTKNGDQTGAPDGTVKVTDRNGFGGPYLTGLNLVSEELVNGKLNLSISFKYLDLSNNGKYQIFLKGYGPQDSNNHRIIGLILQGTENGIEVSQMVFNSEQQYGNAKNVGTLGTSAVVAGDITFGVTLDYSETSSSFWVYKPGQHNESPWGLTTASDVQNSNQTINFGPETLQALPSIEIKQLQFNLNLVGGLAIVDQIKISTGEYKNTENTNNNSDNTSPIITLLGESVVTVEVGSNYVDPGATASDNVDGDLTASIITTSDVDTSNGGTYTITYNVSDAAGNAAPTVVRTVIVESSYSSSTSPITFDENWIVGVDGYSIYDINGGNGVSDVAIVQDPQDNGSRGNVLKVQYNDDGQDWQHVLIHLMEGQNRVSVGPNKTLFFDVYTDHSGDPNKGLYTGMIKLEGETSNLEYSFYVSGNGWETISINTAVDKNNNQVSDGEYEKIVFFTSYGDGIHKRQDLRYYDNITFTEGSEIGLYPQPTNSAPAPTFDESSVLNIFSDHYSNTINWSENELRSSWSNGGNTRVIDLSSNDKIVRQTNLNYSGTYWNAGGSNPRGPIDFSNYAYLNLDVWVPAYAGDYTLGVALLTSNEVKVDYTIDGGPAGWRTLTIPVSDFANSEISSVDGIKFEPNPQGSIPIFYWDNLFAWGGSGDNTNTISVNAGVDVVICEDSSLELSIAGPTATNFVELSWSSSGDGIFDNNNDLTPIYSPGPNDLASGFVNLTLTATGFGQTASDSMTLAFVQSHSLSIISGASTQNQLICEGDDIIPIIYSFGNGASSARVVGLPPGIGWTITENVLTISGALNEDISEPKIYSFTVETIAGDNDCTMVAITGTISINPSNECNYINSAKILLNGPVYVTSVDGLILTADDGKCYRLKIIQGSSIELVEVNCN